MYLISLLLFLIWEIESKYELKKQHGNRYRSNDSILSDGIETVKHSTEYTYLGIKITRNANHVDDINLRINKGKSVISELNIMLRGKVIATKTNTIIYDTIVKIVITYG